jgi:hypothetical protein
LKKALSVIFVSLLCAVFLISQSLVELSKQEKERREKLKGKNVRVVTNADLKSMAKKPAVSVNEPEATEEKVAEPGEPALFAGTEVEPMAAQEEPGREGPFYQGISFASRVLPETYLVANPEAALGFPDGSVAVISINGFLDLEFSAENGPGDDIIVYAIRSGSQEGIWPDTMSYAVLAMGDQGDWEAIGRGGGITTPEKFDLGNVKRIRKIRILFKYFDNPDYGVVPWRLHSEEYTIGIDAVGALH